jgi:hypothetical protein
MGRIKEYLFGIAQEIHDGDFIDHEDLNYDGSKHDDRVISAGIDKYINKTASSDEMDHKMQSFVQGHTELLLDMVKDIIGISPDEQSSDEEDEDWIDPAGGVHYGDEEDPAKMYESDDSGIMMPRLLEDDRTLKPGFHFHNLSAGKEVKYKGKKVKLTSVGADHAYAKGDDGKEIKITSIKQISPINESEEEDEKEYWMYQIAAMLETTFGYEMNEADMLVQICQSDINRMYKMRYNPWQVANFIAHDEEANNELGRQMSDSKYQDDFDYSDYVPKTQKISNPAPTKQETKKDYSKLSRYDIEKEIDKAIAAKDYETLKVLSQFVKESDSRGIFMPRIDEWFGTTETTDTLNIENDDNAMDDVWEAGQKIVNIFKTLGFYDAHLTNMGRAAQSKESQIGFTIESERTTHEFQVDYNGTVHHKGLMYGQKQDTVLGNIDNPKELAQELERIIV